MLTSLHNKEGSTQCSKKYMAMQEIPIGKLYQSKESYSKNYGKNYQCKKKFKWYGKLRKLEEYLYLCRKK